MLFDMILSAAASWGLGKILDTVTGCYQCGQKDNRQIGNQQFNHLECSNCHKEASQFTNACADTVDPATGQIGHAIVIAEDWSLETQGFLDSLFGGSAPRLQSAFQLMERGLAGRTLLFSHTVLDFEDEQPLSSNRIVWTPCFCKVPRCIHNRRSYWQPGDILAKHKIIASDVEILSEHKEVLFRNRRLIDRHGVH